MWNSARKRKENVHSPRWKTARNIKKKSRGGGRGVVGRCAPFTVFSTWAGVNYLDVVCVRACVRVCVCVCARECM